MKRWLGLVVLLGVVMSGCSSRRPGDASAGAEGQAAKIQLDPEQVPEPLRSLIPFAQVWGIGDDVERSTFIAQSPSADRETLRRAIAPHQARITVWLDSFGTNPLSDEAAAFMYMQLAVEEMPGD